MLSNAALKAFDRYMRLSGGKSPYGALGAYDSVRAYRAARDSAVTPAVEAQWEQGRRMGKLCPDEQPADLAGVIAWLEGPGGKPNIARKLRALMEQGEGAEDQESTPAARAIEAKGFGPPGVGQNLPKAEIRAAADSVSALTGDRRQMALDRMGGAMRVAVQEEFQRRARKLGVPENLQDFLARC